VDHLYVVQSDVSGAIKIGRSKDPQSRLKQLQTGSPYKLKLLVVVPEKGNIEKSLHQKFSYYKQNCKGEWFDFNCVGSFPDWLHEMIDWEVANVWWEKK